MAAPNCSITHPPFHLPRRLVVICGATATGKSGLALDLAQRWQDQAQTPPPLIISADSRQVYREFDIGTAKPSRAERQRVPHALIDCCEPTETLTLAAYQRQVQQLWPASTHLNQPFLVGGTGLYIKAIVRGLKIPRVAPQPELRTQLSDLGQQFCRSLLEQVDPVAAAKIHPNDQVRTLRALEVFYVSGQPISQQQGEAPPAQPILQIGLDCTDPDRLAERIAQRTGQMLEAGFVAEVSQLCQKYDPDLPLLETLGYQEIKRYLAGELTLAAAEAEIVLHTRQFAKQQRTWFRADPTIEWFDADNPKLSDVVWTRVWQFLADST
ncbi:MAG: tRNA (adenosine(37)-N6)-dimethylallyltransferase MiaA [Elainella sp.]